MLFLTIHLYSREQFQENIDLNGKYTDAEIWDALDEVTKKRSRWRKNSSFSEPVQKISAEPTALTASTESAPEPMFLPADSNRTPR
jgi:hypothetical protein